VTGAAHGPGVAGGARSPWRRLLSTGCGLGLLPRAPGTWASAATALLVVLLFGLRGFSEPLLTMHASPAAAPGDALVPAGAPAADGAWWVRGLVLAALALVFAGGVWLGNRATADFGVSDPGPFVLDEVVGQGLALLPLLPGPLPAWGVLAGFLLFRLFDIWKPPPCAALERLHGGLGIMADDVMAGAYAAVIVAVLPV